ncbi:hypothetical protein JCM11641_006572 [Rhodosporidiobolus odoratus]
MVLGFSPHPDFFLLLHLVMDSRSLNAWDVPTLAPVVTYALAPGTTSLSTVTLIACTVFCVKSTLANLFLSTWPLLPTGQLACLLLSLVVGSTFSLLLTNSNASSILSSTGDTLFAVTLYALSTAFFPLFGRFAGEALLLLSPPRTPYSSLLFSAWTFAIAGVVQEKLGVGRVLWWVSPEQEGLTWLARVAGQVVLDLAVGGAGVAAGHAAFSAFSAPGENENLLGEEGDATPRQQSKSSWTRLREPTFLALAIAFLALLGPIIPSPSYRPSHPSPTDPEYTYPPLKVACVVPPSSTSREISKPSKPGQTPLDQWLQETVTVAGRRAKVLSWSEGAVRLHRGGKGDKEGWEGMGFDEQDLLRRVGEVCNAAKVYVLATYLVPPPASSETSKHKLLNVATLVGPSTLATEIPPAGQPYIVWSTTKQHPVPFVESYTHSSRRDLILASAPGVVPLASIQLQHESHVPGRRSTPLQELSLSGAICQDIAFPSLLNSFLTPYSTSPRPYSPQLLLNPSLTPLTSLALPQVAQSRLRALEHSSFLLRCDGSTGTSALIAPNGEFHTLVHGEDGRGSWEAEIAIERASSRKGTAFEKVPFGGRSRIGTEGALLAWSGLTLGVLYLGESGKAGKAVGRTEWKEHFRRARRAMEWVRMTTARLVARESEEGMGREGLGIRGEERLIDVD